jgi:uncharacterized protein YjiK
VANLPTLQLVQESKIAELLPDETPGVEYEASGVLLKDGKCFVVFDNHTSVARLAENLSANLMNGRFGVARVADGYEGITFNDAKGRYYLLVESRKQKSGKYRAELFEYDSTLSFIKSRPLDFEFESENKGFEAVCYTRREGKDYVLGLCEGNRCKSGKAGRIPGNGRVQLFAKKNKKWEHRNTIKLPKSVVFRDYSGMAIDENRVAVVSQEDSLLWIGIFEEGCWDWRDEGQTYAFPRTDEGDILYGNVEGVAWRTRNRIVIVSDRRKSDQAEAVAAKDQSIHLFDLPR